MQVLPSNKEPSFLTRFKEWKSNLKSDLRAKGLLDIHPTTQNL